MLRDHARHIRYLPFLDGEAEQILKAIEREALEGIVAKVATSRYEPDKRSGSWSKFKVSDAGAGLVNPLRTDDVDHTPWSRSVRHSFLQLRPAVSLAVPSIQQNGQWCSQPLKRAHLKATTGTEEVPESFGTGAP